MLPILNLYSVTILFWLVHFWSKEELKFAKCTYATIENQDRSFAFFAFRKKKKRLFLVKVKADLPGEQRLPKELKVSLQTRVNRALSADGSFLGVA